MKGLLIKDLRLMKNQRLFFLIMIVVGLAFMFVYGTPSFALTYVTMMFGMFSITSFTYDEFENGGAYLFTLPFERRDYVLEKYAFGYFIVIAAWALMSVCTWFIANIRGIPYEFIEWAAVSLVTITLSVCFICLALPIEIKFGVEKGRMGFILVLGCFFLLYYVMMRILEYSGTVDPVQWIEQVLTMKLHMLALSLAAFWVVASILSILISMRFMNRKEY